MGILVLWSAVSGGRVGGLTCGLEVFSDRPFWYRFAAAITWRVNFSPNGPTRIISSIRSGDLREDRQVNSFLFARHTSAIASKASYKPTWTVPKMVADASSRSYH